MREIYLPNIFRRENIRKSPKGDPVTNIPYIIDFDLKNDKELLVMLNYQLSIIIENILLYDRVYLDLMDFPVALFFLYHEDKNSFLEIIKNSYISFINCDEVEIALYKNENKTYSIAFMSRDGSKIDSEKKLADILFNNFKIGKEISSQLKQIFEESKKKPLENINVIGKYIVHLVDTELKANIYQQLGLGDGKGNYFINDKNKGLCDVICQIIRDETIASLFNINTIYHNDIHKDIVSIRLKYYNNFNDDFKELMRINDIPDISKLFLEGHLVLKDILSLKKSRAFLSFQNWFFNKKGENDDVVKSFFQATKEKSKLDSIPTKVIRFLATSTLGIINPIVGTVGGVLDAFTLDNLKKITPDVFFDNLSKRVKKSSISEEDIEIVPVHINRDTKEINSIKTKDEIDFYKEIINIGEQIITLGDPILRLKLLKEAEKIFKSYSSFNTFYAFISCNINYSSKGPNECKYAISYLEDLFKSVKEENRAYANCIRNAIVVILVNAMIFELDKIAIPRILTFLKNPSMRNLYITFLNENKNKINSKVFNKCMELL